MFLCTCTLEVIVYQTRPFTEHLISLHSQCICDISCLSLQYSVQLTLCKCIFKYILYLFSTQEWIKHAFL